MTIVIHPPFPLSLLLVILILPVFGILLLWPAPEPQKFSREFRRSHECESQFVVVLISRGDQSAGLKARHVIAGVKPQIFGPRKSMEP